MYSLLCRMTTSAFDHHDLNQVEPLLYIGDYKCRRRDTQLKEANIRFVIACGLPSEREHHYFYPLPSPIRVHDYFFDDHESVNIIPHVYETHRLISEAHERGEAVLVHCVMGISRSATLVMGHLMLRDKISREEALAKVETARPCVFPLGAFYRQLNMLFIFRRLKRKQVIQVFLLFHLW